MRQPLTEALVIFCVLWLGQSQRADAQSNGVLREVYTGIGGTAISDLTNSASFPDSPTTVEVISDSFEEKIQVQVFAGLIDKSVVLRNST